MLVIQGYKIEAPMRCILDKLKVESGTDKLKDIGVDVSNNIQITCPIHKGGHETHPSCNIYSNPTGSVQYGKCYCFTCGWRGSLVDLVNVCFQAKDKQFGEQWLLDNFKGSRAQTVDWLQDIVIKQDDKQLIPEHILARYNYYHPYMEKRHISKEVADMFKIGYDKTRDALVFPVWDEHNDLVMLTYRSVNNKSFYIDKNKEKPVYLLNFAQQYKVKFCVVVEGQIDALVSWSYGVPAIGLFGSGTTEHQMDVINKSGINHFVLMYDNDNAGRKGAQRFKSLCKSDKIITDILMPPYKDVGDCTQEEFLSLLKEYNVIEK